MSSDSTARSARTTRSTTGALCVLLTAFAFLGPISALAQGSHARAPRATFVAASPAGRYEQDSLSGEESEPPAPEPTPTPTPRP